MKYVWGLLLVTLGFAHGIHVLGIDAGSINPLGAGRFFSFSELDRLAATGLPGKLLVLMADGLLIALGLLDIRKRRAQVSSAKRLRKAKNKAARKPL